MSSPDIVRMANQIADFFRAYPAEEAEAGIAEHILQFWEPRMRDELRSVVEAGGGGLAPLALAGAKRALSRRGVS